MRDAFGFKRRRQAQTLVFFILAFGTIVLLCGLAIDSGLLFLAKARLSRAVDGAALAAVGNFHRSDDPATNRDAVATIMRNFATANFTDLSYGPNGGISTTASATQSSYTLPNGTTAYIYTYNFNDGTQDANSQFKRFVKVTLTTGAGGQITQATCEARCPAHTYFIGYAGSYFRDLKVSSSAVATRNPRLIVVVVDRSASMLSPGGGAYGLPQAIVQFLNFFDTSSDYISIVSFSSNARVEMPLTTNFIVAGTNLLFNAYQIDTVVNAGVPGADPEMFSTNSDYDVNYATTGVRRLKFGGQTAADEGIRLGMEQLMANSGFNDPNVVKYMVLFTDGKWNQTRTLLAAPGYTNIVRGPPVNTSDSTHKIVSTTRTWGTNMALNTNIVPMPTLSPMPGLTNAIAQHSDWYTDFALLAPNHQADYWISSDGINEPLGTPVTKVGAPPSQPITTNTYLGGTGTNATYTHNIDVWLQPGSVSYFYSPTNSTNPKAFVSNFNDPDQHISLYLSAGESNVLVVPGYVTDGLIYDGMDLPFPDNSTYQGLSTYPCYRCDNFAQAFMWPDDPGGNGSTDFTAMNSMMRGLMFRNYMNLLTGFFIVRPDEPEGLGIEHFTGAKRPLYGLGPYYPSAGFYWPFDLVGIESLKTYCLRDATFDPDPNHSTSDTGGSRHLAYSISMLSPAAAPRWYGEWFYKGNGAALSGASAASTLMNGKSDWQLGAASTAPWILSTFDNGSAPIMTNEPAHNSNLAVSVWRPATFQGTPLPAGYAGVTPSGSVTGGYVTDGLGTYYANSMCYSGRPTHYFDFSNSTWIPIADNHAKNAQALPLCYWKSQEYAWHARAMGVTIYTVGYGSLVVPAQQVILAQIANSTNTTAGNPQSPYVDGPGTAITYNPSQPVGQQFYATTADEISNDFYQVGQAINAALTQ